MPNRMPTREPRRLPLPTTEPPYDDQVGTSPPPVPVRRRSPDNGSPVQGTLALSVAPSGRTPAVPQVRPPLRVVGGPAASQPEPGTTPPDPRRWSAWFARMAVEVLYGRRALPQLIRWTSEDVYTALARRVTRRSRAVPADTPSIRLVRICRINARVIEAAVVLQTPRRARAMAIRAEVVDDRWLCTALELI